MSKTLLDGVNDVLKRVQIIKGETGELTSLSQSTIQHEIDTCVQYWNEAIEELYAFNDYPFPGEAATADITLQTNVREYDLPSDLLQIRWPMMEEPNGYYIFEWKKGYENLRATQQLPDNYVGRPNFALINPQNSKLYMDYIPTATENGLTYELLYDKDVALSGASSAMPFNDATYRAMVPCVAELWKYDQRKEINMTVYRKRFAQACRYLNKKTINDSYVCQ